MVKAAVSSCTFAEMKESILNSFPSEIAQPEKLEFGYVEPGHGLKGKKEWILDDDDVKKFLMKYGSKKKKELLTLWCFSQGKDNKTKRAQSEKSSKPGSSRYEAHNAKMAKVDEIYKKIHNEHGSRYSTEQKRAWAHLIELGKHDSITQPPRKRFFQSTSSTMSGSPAKSTASVTTSVTTSPGRRRVSIRSECIDQLQKWHSLLDCGAISRQQYDELQSTILSDIKNL